MREYTPDLSPDSEPAFHNYINFIQVEKTYFLEEALVDWRHKAMRIDVRSPMPLILNLFSPGERMQPKPFHLDAFVGYCGESMTALVL